MEEVHFLSSIISGNYGIQPELRIRLRNQVCDQIEDLESCLKLLGFSKVHIGTCGQIEDLESCLACTLGFVTPQELQVWHALWLQRSTSSQAAVADCQGRSWPRQDGVADIAVQSFGSCVTFILRV